MLQPPRVTAQLVGNKSLQGQRACAKFTANTATKHTLDSRRSQIIGSGREAQENISDALQLRRPRGDGAEAEVCSREACSAQPDPPETTFLPQAAGAFALSAEAFLKSCK